MGVEQPDSRKPCFPWRVTTGQNLSVDTPLPVRQHGAIMTASGKPFSLNPKARTDPSPGPLPSRIPGEGQIVERKESLGERREIVETCAAFASASAADDPNMAGIWSESGSVLEMACKWPVLPHPHSDQDGAGRHKANFLRITRGAA